MFVEVFVTSISDPQEAKATLAQLRKLIPGCRASFDLEDCDKILKVVVEQEADLECIIHAIIQKGHHIAVLS